MQFDGTLSYQQFQKSSHELIHISSQINDGWTINVDSKVN